MRKTAINLTLNNEKRTLVLDKKDAKEARKLIDTLVEDYIKECPPRNLIDFVTNGIELIMREKGIQVIETYESIDKVVVI